MTPASVNAAQPDRLRLFIALSVPSEVKQRILEAQAHLKKVAGQGIRWSPPEQFHITLRFLGNVDVEKEGALTSELTNACRGFGALQLQASGIGFFPRPQSPRVVWVGVIDQSNRLPELHKRIQDATNSFTQEAAEDRFKGHVTIGRVRERLAHKEAGLLSEAAANLRPTEFGRWELREVELVRSQLSPNGAVYSVLASVPLD